MKLQIILSTVALVLLLFSTVTYGNLCDFTIGKNKYYLSKAVPSSGFFELQSTTERYYVSMCQDLPAANACPGKSSMAAMRSSFGSFCTSLSNTASAKQITASLRSSSDPSGGVKILYGNDREDGHQNKAEIHVLCDSSASNADNFKFITAEDRGDATVHVFHYTSKCACPGKCGSGGGGSGRTCGALGCVYGWGGLILTLSAVGLLLYFVIGFAILKFKMQKEGIEVIPNVHFWMDIPFLLKDGAMFIVDLFRKITKKGENYETL